MLKYAHEKGCKWNAETCKLAAKGGHMDVLKYAHENGCPWDRHTCGNAVWSGHVNVLEYALANGCPWDASECLRAAKTRGNAELVAWIERQPAHNVDRFYLDIPLKELDTHFLEKAP